MTIKEGSSSCAITNTPCPTSAMRAYHVETTIEGIHKVEDDTEGLKMLHGKALWNKTIVRTFRSIETPTPIIISMSMYKKKTFHAGFKLVGSAHFPLMDLVKILNQIGRAHV